MSFWKKKAAILLRGRTTVNVFAPAKINLTLHVVGHRRDGYHLLDSLVTFAPFGDSLTISEGKGLTLVVDGPERLDVPDDMQNLVLKAARMLSPDNSAAITLAKNLPAASGMGGGSADAAAAFRGLHQFWQMGDLAKTDDSGLSSYAAELLQLGADIPMCLMSSPARVGGIGDKVEPVADLPPLPALLVNPRQPVSTAEVFEQLRPKISAPMPEAIPSFSGVSDCVAWLAKQRNDLQATAVKLHPVIGDVLNRLTRSDQVMLTRMSGSGATCFGLFPDKASAIVAGELIRRDHPDWWVAGGILGDQMERAMPVVN